MWAFPIGVADETASEPNIFDEKSAPVVSGALFVLLMIAWSRKEVERERLDGEGKKGYNRVKNDRNSYGRNEYMKLISWNVNGFRACLGKGFEEFFREVNAMDEKELDIKAEAFALAKGSRSPRAAQQFIKGLI